MNYTTIPVLDFDGVICDSAVETGISGWKAARQIWPKMADVTPDSNFLDQFRAVRPMLETGYEAILIVRLLYLGESAETLLKAYHAKTQALLAAEKLEIKFLKQLFGATRDQWIANDMDDWIQMNPLFNGVADKLQRLNQASVWYIVTTKQERFVKQILTCHQIHLADERLLGLERNLSKEGMLMHIMARHPDASLILVEDRLPTLQDVARNTNLHNVKLLLASWGYNTEQEKQSLVSEPIELLTLENFLEFPAQSS
jgi:phosphoglycolate phosphatase-like HAD superfamily hydrolase